jgi:hypothetical protein
MKGGHQAKTNPFLFSRTVLQMTTPNKTNTTRLVIKSSAQFPDAPVTSLELPYWCNTSPTIIKITSIIMRFSEYIDQTCSQRKEIIIIRNLLFLFPIMKTFDHCFSHIPDLLVDCTQQQSLSSGNITE